MNDTTPGSGTNLIQAVYETHLHVRDLERSTAFYDQLGLARAHVIPGRAAFYWVGTREHMLGLWQLPPDEPARPAHFAFRTTLTGLLNAADWLRERGIEPKAAFGVPPTDFVVHAWMPAATLYFDDPDGHNLEFLALLDAPARPELGALAYTEWLTLSPVPA